MVLKGEDFDMVAGDDANLNIHVQAPDISGVLQSVDLTGSTITWVLKESENSSTALVTKVSTDALQVEKLNQTTHTGEFVVYLQPADTASLTAGHYFHGAVVVDVALDKHTVTEGYLTLSAKLI
jgi:hypothetical protein